MSTRVHPLEREVFSESDAARLLRVPQGTLHYWLEGGVHNNSTYQPVLRAAPTGRRILTWGEFVEASLIRQYRRQHKVPLSELRDFIVVLRETFDDPYPLANQRPFISGRRLVIEAQNASDLPEDLWLIAPTTKQPLLLPPAQAFLDRIDFDDGLAVRYHPHTDPDSPVIVDPELRFGKPSVSGISTTVLWEHVEDGYGADEVAEEFGLKKSDVDWAVSFENSLQAA